MSWKQLRKACEDPRVRPRIHSNLKLTDIANGNWRRSQIFNNYIKIITQIKKNKKQMSQKRIKKKRKNKIMEILIKNVQS